MPWIASRPRVEYRRREKGGVHGRETVQEGSEPDVIVCRPWVTNQTIYSRHRVVHCSAGLLPSPSLPTPPSHPFVTSACDAIHTTEWPHENSHEPPPCKGNAAESPSSLIRM